MVLNVIYTMILNVIYSIAIIIYNVEFDKSIVTLFREIVDCILI